MKTKSNQTPLVRSQKEFNNAVSIVRNHLGTEGVLVERGSLERAMAPALSNGKKHAVMCAELKRQPKTAGGVVYKNLVCREKTPESHKSNEMLLDMLTSLKDELSYAMVFQSFFEQIAKSLLTVTSSLIVDLNSLTQTEMMAVKGFYEALESQKFDLFHFVKPYENDSCNFVFESVFGKNSISFSGELIDECEINFITEVEVNGKTTSEAFDSLINAIFSEYVERFGFVPCSNKFTTKISAELMQAMITEANDQAFQAIVSNEQPVETKLEQDLKVESDATPESNSKAIALLLEKEFGQDDDGCFVQNTEDYLDIEYCRKIKDFDDGGFRDLVVTLNYDKQQNTFYVMAGVNDGEGAYGLDNISFTTTGDIHPICQAAFDLSHEHSIADYKKLGLVEIMKNFYLTVTSTLKNAARES